MSLKTIPSPVTGVIWKVLVAAGTRVEAGSEIILVESMKMEIPVVMPETGTLRAICVQPDDSVAEGQPVAEYE